MKSLLICFTSLLVCAGALAQSAPATDVSAASPSQDVVVLCYHDVRDQVGIKQSLKPGQKAAADIVAPGVGSSLDAEQFTTSTRNLAGHFDWLRSHGYHVISLQQLIDARSGRGALPDKAVLLTFDDGLRSAYTNVFPLLKAYKFPAVMAVVGAWTDLPDDGKVDNGALPLTREDFATWDELREMQSSGLVEIASHTYNQHHGILANPQGNMIPAVVTHEYRPLTHDYETDEEYIARLRADLARNSDEIREKLGRAPRAIMWPYGEYSRVSDEIAASLDMTVSFTLGDQIHYTKASMQAIPRILMMSNATVGDLTWELRQPGPDAIVRAVQVDLDYIYDPDPKQQERNLGLLLDRIKAMGATQVWLQAFADPDGDDSAAAVYFPNHVLPMRADLFSRVAWQLRTRCGVEVYAWMPVLGWRLPNAAQQARLQIRPRPGVAPENPVRLNPFLSETRKVVDSLYEDLARSSALSGILFHDDAVLRDTDELGPAAPPPGPARTQALIDFTSELKAHSQRWRPSIKSARNLFAEPVLDPGSEIWYAQSLPAFLKAYDEVALMAMPGMEDAKHPNEWLLKLTAKVSAVPGAMDRTVFEMQTVDWRNHDQLIATSELVRQMRLLQEHGVRDLGYYPDDFAKNNPKLDVLKPEFSASDSLPPDYVESR
ncbi:MAG: poly-beta-1,6-N-acetyl-D-glucosamine N-deacetylase PgaB [Terracidiphilus sp.]